jgi:hypothetical protein
MTGSLLRYTDLNPAEQALIKADFLRRRPVPGMADHILYLRVMHSWGVICPHPQESRMYEGLYWSDSSVDFEECQWYVCQVCECIVINREVADA